MLTCGDKGSSDRAITTEILCGIRQEEQRKAAAAIGAEKVRFLGYPDGYLVPDLEMRRAVTRVIRQERPDILVTSDPLALYIGDRYINHPDHRAAGQVTLDAVFPAARSHLFFEELLTAESLEPHTVREVWVTLVDQPNLTLDVTATWEVKIQALYEHQSQIGDKQKFTERMRSRHTPDSTPEQPRYEERFRRLIIG